MKLDHRQAEDHAYRQAWGINGRAPWGHPLRAAFYEYLGPAPMGRYVSREDARRYADQIRDVMDLAHPDGEIQWTRYEKNRLRALWLKWMRRAQGQDHRFNVMGVQGGAPTPPKRIAPWLCDANFPSQ